MLNDKINTTSNPVYKTLLKIETGAQQQNCKTGQERYKQQKVNFSKVNKKHAGVHSKASFTI